MTSDYLNHVRSLEELHKIIECDPALGSMEAVAMLVKDVQAVAEKVAEDTEKLVAHVYKEAKGESAKLAAKTSIAVSKINNDATKVATDLIRGAQSRENAKDAAIAAKKILKIAEKAAAKLNLRAVKASAMVTERAETAVSNVKRVGEAAISDLIDAGGKATESLVQASKDASARLQASENGSSRNDEFFNGARAAAANVIKVLALSTERMNQAADTATAKLQAATDEAVTWVRQAANEATATVVVAIEAANKAVLEITKKAITKLVGEEKVSLFDLEALKRRWRSVG